MSSRITILLLTILNMLAHGVFAQQVFDPQLLDKIILREQKNSEPKVTFRESGITDDYDLNYLRAYWEIDPAVYYIKGAVTYHFKPVGTEMNAIYFDISDSLVVHYFVYHGDTSYNFSRPGSNTLRLPLPQPVAASIQDSITIAYEGIPPSTGFGSFTQETHNDQPIIWTLSEPYGASDWFPCKNSLTDKMDSIDIFIRTPSVNSAGTAGILMSETPVAGTNEKIIHWRHRYPIVTYLIGIAVTDYAIIEQQVTLNSGNKVPVLQYLYPEDSANYVNDSSLIGKFLILFSDLFGDYPFYKEKYGHAQWNWGGGEEHQTMSFVLGAGYFELVAHELAHQWFGNKITCGSWNDIWLNEGFATYLSGLAYEHIAPQYWMAFKETQQGRAFKDSTGSVFCDDTTDVSRIFSGSLSYAKGAYLLHMLRWKLGDEDFFNAIRHYINDPELSFGFARTHHLQDHLEAESGQDLDEFFNDWYYGKGYPTYYAKWANLSDGTVKITLHQTQNHPSVDFFEMPVPVRLKNGLNDTTIVIQHLQNDVSYLAGPFGFTPDSIFVDPERWLLAKKAPAVYEPLLTDVLVIYPNPAMDYVSISYQGIQDPVTSLVLYDAAGRKLIESGSGQLSFYEPVVLDLSGLSGGYYILEVITEANRYLRRLVKF